MPERRLHLQLGIGAVLVAALLLFWAIPTWVSSPSNVRNIVLSPLFWPNTLAALTALIGLSLIATALRLPRAEKAASDVHDRPQAVARLVGAAVVMVVTFWALPRLGLVWTAMLAFAALAFLVKTRHPGWALGSAVLVPLLLYLFFAKVAGVAIPQGEFIRLP
ncbi:tripartite tricarboxylate transporter TctB family protein [Jannaschia ovalis]|uniref:Tripartite tricarboxylate transporter TctB family protein n=1 Tax=Jannaschia ovalis TaxID=3038773 RepID=A0ABY8L7F7_9RHOB|nr:tripartite tricarboxylate transporter TctB family protein [Jannaschia sp. GRR-S6-38]WGH77306.1 tripartite tricarboxylate transporter TctB family protein [Jannaschia sp. GRR-S6-38]